jgi:hypothetical protein
LKNQAYLRYPIHKRLLVKRFFYGQVVRIRLLGKIEKQAEKELVVLSNQTPLFTGLQIEN